MELREYLLENRIPFREGDGYIFVRDDLDLRGTNVTSLPEGLQIEGYLDLRGTKVISLPEGLQIEGNLYSQDTKIVSIPERLKIGGNLFLDDTLIDSITEGLKRKVFVRIKNQGEWEVYISQSGVRIGCKKKTVPEWEQFFKERQSVETDPAIEPEAYALIQSDFNSAKEVYEKYFK